MVSERLRTERILGQDEQRMNEEADTEAGIRVEQMVTSELPKWEAKYGSDLPRRTVKRGGPVTVTETGIVTDAPDQVVEERSTRVRERGNIEEVGSGEIERVESSTHMPARGCESDIRSVAHSEVRAPHPVSKRISMKSSGFFAGPGYLDSSVAGVVGEHGRSLASEGSRNAIGQKLIDKAKYLEMNETTDDKTCTNEEKVYNIETLEGQRVVKGNTGEKKPESHLPTNAAQRQSQGGVTAPTEDTDSDAPDSEGPVASPHETLLEPKAQAERSLKGKSIDPIEQTGSFSSKTTQGRERGKIELKEGVLEEIPEQEFELGLSHRICEWTKHLSASEVPALELIHPLREEGPAKYEVAAPVHVKELLQTPLNARVPPAIQRRASVEEELSLGSNSNRGRRSPNTSKDSSYPQNKTRDPKVGSRTHQSRVRSRSMSNLVVSPAAQTQQRRNFTAFSSNTTSITMGPERPQGENAQSARSGLENLSPLLTVCEDRMRSRLSPLPSTYDTYNPQNRSEQQPHSARPPPLSPTLSSPIRANGDDLPLSQRRALIKQQQQTVQLSSQVRRPGQNPRRSGLDPSGPMIRAAAERRDPLARRRLSSAGSGTSDQLGLRYSLGQTQRRHSYYGHYTTRYYTSGIRYNRER